MSIIAASLMCGDQLNIEKELRKLEAANCELLHLDVMDGKFVNNLALGPEWIEAVKKGTNIPLDIHLATIEPLKYIKMFAPIRPDYISFHVETAKNVIEVIDSIRSYGVKPAIAINPETKIEKVTPYLNDIEMIVVMTVNPGFSGQAFNLSVLDKIKEVKEILSKREHKPLIEVDGNINEKSIGLMGISQPDIYVLGTSALFHKRDMKSYKERIRVIKKKIEESSVC